MIRSAAKDCSRPSRDRWKLILDDGCERVGLEAGSADKRAVDFFLTEEGSGVVGLDAAAVEDADGGGDIGAKQLRHFIPDDLVGIDGHLRRGGFASAYGPDRLIGYDDGSGDFGRDPGKGSRNLRATNMLRLAALALFEHFA